MTVQEYLEAKLREMASQDPNFRERYEDEQKSMNDCISYIEQQAQKQAVNGCAAISDDEVFQMAVHYYQEKDVNPTKGCTPRAEITTSKPKAEKKPKQEAKPQPVLIPEPKANKRANKKAKKGSDNSLQLDLFGGM